MIFSNLSSTILNAANSTIMSDAITLDGTSAFNNSLTFITNNGLTNMTASEDAYLSELFTVDQIESVSEVVYSCLDQSISGLYILQIIRGNNSQQLKLLRK